MSDNRDLQQRIQRIRRIGSRDRVHCRPQCASFHETAGATAHGIPCAGLDRALEITAKTGDSGLRLIDEFGHDPLVSSLLVFVRIVFRRLGDSREQGRRTGFGPKCRGTVGRWSCWNRRRNRPIATGAQRSYLRLHRAGPTLQVMAEEAIYEAAPDLVSILVEGLEGKPAGGFVSLDKLLGGGSLLPGVAGEPRQWKQFVARGWNAGLPVVS